MELIGRYNGAMYSACSICGNWHGPQLTCEDARRAAAMGLHWHVNLADGTSTCMGFDEDGWPVCAGCHKPHPMIITCPMAVDWRTWFDANKKAKPSPTDKSLEAAWGDTVLESFQRAQAMERLERGLHGS